MPGETGNPLPDDVRSAMESSFGADFSNVRVHTDSSAASMSGNLNARAHTVGNHIYFKSGQYAPDTSHGRNLIAHELTHVVQQSQRGNGGAGGNGKPDVDTVQAQLNGHLVAGGMKAVLHGITGYLP